MGNKCCKKQNDNDYQELLDNDKSIKNINDNLFYYKNNCIKLKDYLKKFKDYNLIESKENGLNPRHPAENYLLVSCYLAVSKRIEYADRTIFTTKVNDDEYVFYIISYPFRYDSLSVLEIKNKYFK